MGRNVYYIDSVGEVTFEKSYRSKSLRITVHPDKGVRVSYPGHVSISNAFRFVEEKSEWIRKSVERARKMEKKPTLFLPGVHFSTREHELRFVQHTSDEYKVKISPGIIGVYYATEHQLNTEAGQQLIRKGIDYALRMEAKQLLPDRVEQLALKHGFQYNGVAVKNLSSRWGSCSSANHINLNIQLLRLPDHLMDYVILHELVHTVHKNHGKQFWQLLGEVSGDARLLAREMKNYRTRIY